MSSTTSPLLMHSTYFKLLPDSSEDIRNEFMKDCQDYLSTSPGMISFWVGERATDMERPQNDLNFDLAMHQVFQNKAAFDHYNGKDPKHEKFVEEVNKLAPATTRRVMDTYLSHFNIGGNPMAMQQVGNDGNWPQGLFHSIYFSLTDKSQAAIDKFTQVCLNDLSHHEGICIFAIGGLSDIVRDVSFRDFDVAFDIQYQSKAAYDNYLKSEGHDAFFPATAGMIKDTFIFDSYLKFQTKVYSLTR